MKPQLTEYEASKVGKCGSDEPILKPLGTRIAAGRTADLEAFFEV